MHTQKVQSLLTSNSMLHRTSNAPLHIQGVSSCFPFKLFPPSAQKTLPSMLNSLSLPIGPALCDTSFKVNEPLTSGCFLPEQTNCFRHFSPLPPSSSSCQSLCSMCLFLPLLSSCPPSIPHVTFWQLHQVVPTPFLTSCCQSSVREIMQYFPRLPPKETKI